MSDGLYEHHTATGLLFKILFFGESSWFTTLLFCLSFYSGVTGDLREFGPIRDADTVPFRSAVGVPNFIISRARLQIPQDASVPIFMMCERMRLGPRS